MKDINKIGKSYAKRNLKYEEAEKDYYPTPGGLVIELIATGVLKDCKTILEPASGDMAISKILDKHGFNVTSKDIRTTNDDFLIDDYTGQQFDAIVTNPPFSLFDNFVMQAKKIDCKKIVFIGKTNFFGCHKRNTGGIWKELSDVYIFDRQVAYDHGQRENGKMECGCLVTGWFVWTKGYEGDPKIHIIDVQKWIAKKNE